MFFLLLSLYVCFSACSGCMNFFPREIFHVWIFFCPLSLLFQWSIPSNLMVHGRCIECFHSRGQNLCKYIGTKESVYITKEFNSHRIGLGHQHGRRFIALGHQYGGRDVMWKHSITRGTGILGTQWTRQERGRINARDKHARKDVLARPSSFARLNFSLSLAPWNAYQAGNLGTR